MAAAVQRGRAEAYRTVPAATLLYPARVGHERSVAERSAAAASNERRVVAAAAVVGASRHTTHHRRVQIQITTNAGDFSRATSVRWEREPTNQTCYKIHRTTTVRLLTSSTRATIQS